MNIKQVAMNSEIILITGETGSGKSVLAKKIHQLSKHSRGNFVQVNISSLNENTIESELFGHVRGAFTGALSEKIGFCTKAQAGTLFIDEIGELSLEKQAKLLTLLDEKIYYPVGSVVKKVLRARIILATNRDLEEMVAKKQFREDLYYRIRFIDINLPPLRKNADINTILSEEIRKLKKEYNREDFCLNIDAEKVLQNYLWPGNYRELHNTTKYLFCTGKKVITISDLPRWILKADCKSKKLCENTYYDALGSFENDYLIQQMRRFHGKINLTSKMIGLSKVTLISKLKKYDIKREDFKHKYEMKQLL